MNISVSISLIYKMYNDNVGAGSSLGVESPIGIENLFGVSHGIYPVVKRLCKNPNETL
jgi:hypothetical protein